MRCRILLLTALLAAGAWAQNVIEDEGVGPVAPPITVTEQEAREVVAWTSPVRPRPEMPEARRVREKLEAHVTQLLDEFPYQGFHHTLGISGYETYFNHPDRLFLSLSGAIPHVRPALRKRIDGFLRTQLAAASPYAVTGWDNRAGRPREAYDVPPALRASGPSQATSVLGVYAFAAWPATGDPDLVRKHWPAVKQRVESLLSAPYAFDPRRSYARDEAQRLNGDLAGLIGAVRLARRVGDAETERRALLRGRELLELRVNLERVNPRVLEKTHSTTKHLHAAKLARYCDLTPEVGYALRKWTDGLAARRLRTFRESRNGWYLAFGDRLIGGENYTNPPHFSHALFTAAAHVEQVPARDLARWIDVPWCRGDFYFLEKCTLALSQAP